CKFGVHRSVPQREARVVLKRLRPDKVVPRPVPASAENKFYRSPGKIGNGRLWPAPPALPGASGQSDRLAELLQFPGVGMSVALGSQPHLEAKLDSLFAAHIESVCARTAEALEACGLQGLLLH